MDQCMEAVRFTHVKACGHSSLPQPEEIVEAEEAVGNGTELAGNATKDLSEFELLLIYADMFNFVS